MKKGMILTLPRSDIVTEYLSSFSQEIIEEADEKNVPCKILENSDANKNEFEKVVKKLDYNLVVFNGHGSADSIKGHKDEVIVKSGENEDMLDGRIVYARACEAGEGLGKQFEEDAAGCFIGYEFKFEFWADSTWDSVPRKDEKAKLFLEPSNMVPISLIKGHSGKEAHDASKKYILKNIKKLLKSPKDDSFWLISSLWNNYNGQVMYGNGEALL